jgi:hypothetical protein
VATNGDFFRFFVHVELECGEAVRRSRHVSTLQICVTPIEIATAMPIVEEVRGAWPDVENK